MQMKIEVGKTYEDRQGKKIEVIYICPDEVDYPVVGKGDNKLHTFTKVGSYHRDDDKNRSDLVREYKELLKSVFEKKWHDPGRGAPIYPMIFNEDLRPFVNKNTRITIEEIRDEN